jgi:hypothetical protein
MEAECEGGIVSTIFKIQQIFGYKFFVYNKLKQEDELHMYDAYRADLQTQETCIQLLPMEAECEGDIVSTIFKIQQIFGYKFFVYKFQCLTKMNGCYLV